ncbi:acetyltransferase, GNAT family protein [Spiroplasma sabaudiense Ar-1343]|uniref:Acetyltransferase, GNAT family protein n=1 Tax=Spiroplasma sabaudiense Ar-1343 TaxID=1276257 RepID=W6A9L2_9MOLU|nr:GNAT family N-acetyltransferase [Spiroplasma sabaudiense]AHI53676.1 acetyltransferase, GNAT family protein [Spiroplasma sabaudiense Ar-1343]
MNYIWFKKNENKDYWEIAKKIRIEVFCVEQAVDEVFEIDEIDENAWHLIVESDNQFIGVGRVFQRSENQWGLGRLAISKDYRGQGLSEPIIKEMVDKITQLGGQEILIHAQAYIQKIYQNFGFSTTTGVVFKEDGIDHIEMKYQIKK